MLGRSRNWDEDTHPAEAPAHRVVAWADENPERPERDLGSLCAAALDDGIVNLTIDLTAVEHVTEDMRDILETVAEALDAYGGALELILPTSEYDENRAGLREARSRLRSGWP